jgi:histidinol-phosphate aminotransferase
MVHVSNPILIDREPYTPGLSREHVAGLTGLPLEAVAKLGSAENPFGASPLAQAAVADSLGVLDIYPSWTNESLRRAIAARYGVTADQVVCGAGETEIIATLIRTFAAPGETVLMMEPCFPIYHIYTENDGRVPAYVPLGPDFALPIDAYVEQLRALRPAIAFITNPHSPSGRFTTEAEIRQICDAAGDTLVVLDEAYIHFTETDGSIHLLPDYPSLIVLRTFSKAFGLAGLRIGFCVATASIIQPMWNAKPTWNLGQAQLAGGVAALKDDAHVERTVAMVVKMRGYVAQRLSGLRAFRMVPQSRANFFLVEILDTDRFDSTRVFEALLKRGVIVKDGSTSFRGLGKRFLRVDVSLQRHMDRFADALAEIEHEGT